MTTSKCAAPSAVGEGGVFSSDCSRKRRRFITSRTSVMVLRMGWCITRVCPFRVTFSVPLLLLLCRPPQGGEHGDHIAPREVARDRMLEDGVVDAPMSAAQ